MKLTFLGATDTVTGSRFLVETDHVRVLVDCGLFQGLKKLRERNWDRFPVDPKLLDAVVLTHAHIDHSGYLPALVAQGFTGPVYATTGTTDLCRILLPDAGYLQEEQARHANKYGYAKHEVARPLYTRLDAVAALTHFEPQPWGEWLALAPDLRLRFTPAGHIIGASCVHLEHKGHRLVFSGDVGRPNDPVMKPPQPLDRADTLVLESTYGDRPHTDTDPLADLEEVINRTLKRRGTLLIPSFAVGRAQALLHLIAELKAQGRIPDVPVALNSPMAISATDILQAHQGDHRLSPELSARLDRGVLMTRSTEESKALTARNEPMIIISASGMATGGRVLHHLRQLAPHRRNTILFVGYQAAGTRGQTLLAGADEVKLHGEYVPINAEVVRLDGLSAHGDHRELIAWLKQTEISPKQVLLVHGEPAAQDAMRRHVRDKLGWSARIPEFGESVALP